MRRVRRLDNSRIGRHAGGFGRGLGLGMGM